MRNAVHFACVICLGAVLSFSYVSDIPVDDPSAINQHLRPPAVDIRPGIPGQEISLYAGSYKIGNYTNGDDMVVSVHGNGAQNGVLPARGGASKAVFFIGGMHGNEEGGILAIEAMEGYVQNRPHEIPGNTIVFVLNPASNVQGSRRIPFGNGHIDPNRDFAQRRLPETKAIVFFIDLLLQNYSEILIVSGHRWDDTGSDDFGKGHVVPMYDLTEAGRRDASRAQSDEVPIRNRILGTHYTVPARSYDLAQAFKECTGFIYQHMWRNEMYRGELMNYLNTLNGNIGMIEFEVPFSGRDLNPAWRAGFANFVRYLLEQQGPSSPRSS